MDGKLGSRAWCVGSSTLPLWFHSFLVLGTSMLHSVLPRPKTNGKTPILGNSDD